MRCIVSPRRYHVTLCVVSGSPQGQEATFGCRRVCKIDRQQSREDATGYVA